VREANNQVAAVAEVEEEEEFSVDEQKKALQLLMESH